ncbi:uncharacterized protein Tco025E_07333 [Trypanosoma conorhini]|uniref:Uncharacterized protein n=1 Tax=Trypanosoma conorhini TaxID=83891 RepID=A0A3R7MTE2_9TRYP|nr:uncharacterized protein Tco025E_07333 [Trypanosoma conorhini]RNF07834.1 hypothetical protein Tco025E_07333 [Trypanosoma conorhini]
MRAGPTLRLGLSFASGVHLKFDGSAAVEDSLEKVEGLFPLVGLRGAFSWHNPAHAGCCGGLYWSSTSRKPSNSLQRSCVMVSGATSTVRIAMRRFPTVSQPNISVSISLAECVRPHRDK